MSEEFTCHYRNLKKRIFIRLTLTFNEMNKPYTQNIDFTELEVGGIVVNVLSLLHESTKFKLGKHSTVIIVRQFLFSQSC